MAFSSTDLLYRLYPSASQLLRVPVTSLLVLTIVVSHFLLNGHDYQRVLQVGFLFIASLIIALTGRASTLANALPASLVVPLCAFFVLGTVSGLLAYSVRHAFLELSSLLLLLIVGLVAAREMATSYRASLRLTLGILAIGIAVYFVQILVPWLAAMLLRAPLDLNSLAPAFSNYRFLNHAQTISLPLLVLMCATAIPVRKTPLFILTACWFALLIALSGRGTMLGLGLGWTAAVLLRRRQAVPFCRLMGQAAILGAFIFVLTCVWIPAALGLPPVGEFAQVIVRTVIAPDGMRAQLWQWSLDIIAAHPWFGIGPMHYAHELADVAYVAHPHSWVMQLGAEWGLPALLSMCVAIVLAARALLKTGRHIAVADIDNQSLLTAWIVIGTAILVDGLVSGNIVMPVSQLLISLYLGCSVGWAWSLSSGTDRPPPSPPGGRYVAGVIVLTAGVALLAGTAPDLPVSGQAQIVYHPRFWLNGHF